MGATERDLVVSRRRREWVATHHRDFLFDLFDRVRDGTVTFNEALLVADILGPTDWRYDAACRDADPDLFFQQSPSASIAEAKSICASCPVVDECSDYANATNEKFGVWGGGGARQRRPSVKGRKQVCVICTRPIPAGSAANREVCSHDCYVTRRRRQLESRRRLGV